MGSTSIQWTEATWNPVRGCSRCSPGCDNCYAMRQAHRFSGKGKAYEGLTTLRRNKVDWTGVVRAIPDAMGAPLRKRKPTKFFVNSMSDLFHPGLSFDDVDTVFAVMGACDDQELGHVFQVLTKRPERAREYLTSERARRAWNSCRMNRSCWPARNLWLGTSCEDHKHAYERIPHLLATPAVIRFISAEPLLGPIDLEYDMLVQTSVGERGVQPLYVRRGNGIGPLDWVIVGGESGQGARPCNIEWIRSIVRHCRDAGVACFVKQLGAKPGFDRELEFARGHAFSSFHHFDEASRLHIKRLADRKGGTMTEWPEELRVREFPRVSYDSAEVAHA